MSITMTTIGHAIEPTILAINAFQSIQMSLPAETTPSFEHAIIFPCSIE
jgi:hypothetical protein